MLYHPSPSLGYTLATSPPPEARGWGGWAGWAGWRGWGGGKGGGGWWGGLGGGGGAAVLTYYRAMVETEPAAARRAMLGRPWS